MCASKFEIISNTTLFLSRSFHVQPTFWKQLEPFDLIGNGIIEQAWVFSDTSCIFLFGRQPWHCLRLSVTCSHCFSFRWFFLIELKVLLTFHKCVITTLSYNYIRGRNPQNHAANWLIVLEVLQHFSFSLTKKLSQKIATGREISYPESYVVLIG